MFCKYVSGFFALACASSVVASIEFHKVSSDGSMDYTSIQAAIDAASDGDIVDVYPGFYQEALNTNGKAISIQGKIDQVTGYRPILIGPDTGDPIFLFHNGEEHTTKISFLTFVNGISKFGGAVSIWDSSPSFHDCFFEQCYGIWGGGAVYCKRSEAQFARCIFLENYCNSFGGAVYLERSPVRFLGCVFSDNYVHGFGGGIYVNHVGGPSMRPTLLSCFFVGNGAHNTAPDIKGGWNHQGFCAFSADHFDGDDDGVPDGLEDEMFNFDGNDEIDAHDLLAALTVFGGMGIYNPGDLDEDDDIDGDDFEIMLKGL